MPRLLPLLLLAIVATGCRQAQIPADGGPYRLRPLGARYAITETPDGKALGIWDLSYPTVERDDLAGDRAETRPHRMVNFADPTEFVRRRRRAAWRQGVASWFAAPPTFGIMKWTLTTDYFDRLEIRAAHRAMLRETLHLLDADRAGPARTGLGSGEFGIARAQLAPDESRSRAIRATANFPRLEAAVRIDLPGVAPPGARLSLERFGEGDAFGLVRVATGGRLEPRAVYDLGSPDGPVLLLSLADDRPFDDEVAAWASLTVNEIGAILITAIGQLIEAVLGYPFPYLSLAINTTTSIWPRAPFREVDPLAAARGRLLVLAEAGPPALPEALEPYRGAIAGRLDRVMIAINRYWLAGPQRTERIAIHRAQLQRGAKGLPVGSGPR